MIIIIVVFVSMFPLLSYANEFNLNIPGPRRFDSKIAIVGAGASGVHMAHLLKQKGFTNVVILEESSRIGGKSFTIQYRGAYHDMGSVTLAPNYRKNVIPLVQKYLPGELIDMPPSAYWMAGKPFHIFQYLVLKTTKGYSTENVKYTRQVITNALKKYLRLHEFIFGDYEFALMPKPSKIGMYMIRGTMEQFLKRYNIMALAPLFQDTTTGVGYGQLNETAALYLLMWNNREYIKPFLDIIHNPTRVSAVSLLTMKRGTQSLWEAIVEKDNLNVQFNVEIRLILRGLEDKQILLLKRVNNSQLLWENYDFLIWSPEMKTSLALFSELYPKEYELFSGTTVMYWTSSITNTMNVRRSFSPVDGFMDNLFYRVENSVWTQIDSYGMRHEQFGLSYKKGKLRTGNDTKKMRSLLTYQLGYRKATPMKYREKLKQHFGNLGGNTVTIRNMTTWRYFPHYSVEDINNGILWKILDIQGMYGMWYIGSSVSFESLRDVVEYNKLIVSYMELPYF